MPRPRVEYLLCCCLLVIGGTACQSPLSPGERNDLLVAQHRWASRGYGDYSIETRSGCFCAPEVNGWVRIEVIDGEVRKATLLETGEVITDARLSYWETVEEVFASIRDANQSSYLDDLRVSFDRVLGFPSEVAWITGPDVLDGGGTLNMRNARPL